MSDDIPTRTQHNGLLPDYTITHHVVYLIILVAVSFYGQVMSVMLNRQLSIKVCVCRDARVCACVYQACCAATRVCRHTALPAWRCMRASIRA